MQTLIPCLNCFLLSEFISLLSDIIHDSFFFLLSPLFRLHAIAYDSFFRVETLKTRAESAVVAAVDDCSGRRLWWRLGLGFRGAAHMAALLVAPAAPAAALGFGVVYAWAEETVTVTEELHLDYTFVYPRASFFFSDGHGLMSAGVPFGHTISVSVALSFPESEHNRKAGMFQLKAQVLTKNGGVVAESSKPCITPFRSTTVRVAHTAMNVIPLLVGAKSETMKMTITGMVQHKEVKEKQRSEGVRVSMINRWASSSNHLPHLSDAQIIITSSPPWLSMVAHRWRYSLSVWISSSLYFPLLAITIIIFRPLVF